MHINNWNEKNYRNFEKFISKCHKNVVNLNYIQSIANSNNLQDIINLFIERTLKTIRLFK